MDKDKKKALDCLHYEISMWEKTFQVLNNQYQTLDDITKNIYLESFLLHSRNLIDFLEDQKDSRDIRCSDFSITKKTVNLPTHNSKNEIQKFLSHISWTRVTKTRPEWKFPKIKQAIAKELQLFFKALPDNYFPTKKNKNRDDFNQLLSSLSS